jgi:predicted MFS family arabinose efflux permease
MAARTRKRRVLGLVLDGVCAVSGVYLLGKMLLAWWPFTVALIVLMLAACLVLLAVLFFQHNHLIRVLNAAETARRGERT